MLPSQRWYRPYRCVLVTATDCACGHHMTHSHPNQVSGHFGAGLKSMQYGLGFKSWLCSCFCRVGKRNQVCRSLNRDGEVGFVVGEIKARQHSSCFIGFQAGSDQNLKTSTKGSPRGSSKGGHPGEAARWVTQGRQHGDFTQGRQQEGLSLSGSNGLQVCIYKGAAPGSLQEGGRTKGLSANGFGRGMGPRGLQEGGRTKGASANGF